MLVPVTFHLSREEAKRVERTNLKAQLELILRVAQRHSEDDPEAAVVASELEKFKDVLSVIWKQAHYKIFEINLMPE